MRIFLRRFFCLPKKSTPSRKSFSTSQKMSSSATAALLYAATISPTAIVGGEPKDAKDKAHHLENGGFINPWPSWLEKSGPAIARALLAYDRWFTLLG